MYSKKLICDILDYIDNNINKEITIEEITSIFFFNRTYIMKSFKKELGITIINYMNSMRIYNSLKDYLNDYHIMKIALNNGFKSIEYYSEMFKKIIGVAPRTYKNFTKRGKYTEKDLNNIRKGLSSLQELKERIEQYKRRRPPNENKIKNLSIFK